MSKAALIDLDGTLSDSGLAIIKSINYALENLGYAKLQGDTSWVVGPSLWPTVIKLGIKSELSKLFHYIESVILKALCMKGLLSGIQNSNTLKTQGYLLAGYI